MCSAIMSSRGAVLTTRMVTATIVAGAESNFSWIDMSNFDMSIFFNGGFLVIHSYDEYKKYT